MNGIEVGICLPNSLDNLTTLAHTCEELGFDSVWNVDGVMDEFIERTYDLKVCLSALANATNRIKIGSCVMATCRESPFNIARFFAALDRYSKGRVIAGLGAGVASQAIPFGVPHISDMLERFKELLKVTKSLFLQEKVNFKGTYFTLNSASLESESLQKPHPPFWLGTNLDRAIRETAEFADGWLPGVTAPEIYGMELNTFIESIESAGRNPKAIVPACFEMINVSKSKKESLDRVGRLLAPIGLWWNRSQKIGYKKYHSAKEVPNEVVEKLSILGSASDCAQRIGEFADAGVKHIILYPLPIKSIPKMLTEIAELTKTI